MPGNRSFFWVNIFIDTDIFAEAAHEIYRDWKLFHDALLARWFAVIHDILPQYGICAA